MILKTGWENDVKKTGWKNGKKDGSGKSIGGRIGKILEGRDGK